jgi:hypothetical protein
MKQLIVIQLPNLVDINILEMQLPTWTQGEIENHNSPIAIKEMKSITSLRKPSTFQKI